MDWGINYHYEQTIITKEYPLFADLATACTVNMLDSILYNAVKTCTPHAGKAVDA
jgi:hypothetical protein